MVEPATTLRLICRHPRRPARSHPVLDALFRRLARCESAEEAEALADRIWDIWMYHPHRSAAEALDRATDDIAARRFEIAETRLALLLRGAPGFAEAWHKRASLFYMTGRDDECVDDLRRTLELEPRHFGALCSFAEIQHERGESEAARVAFAVALSVHPHLKRAREFLTQG